MATVEEAKSQPLFAAYPRRIVFVISVCFVFSGATGLIYEVLWARMLGLVFGATTLAVSTVLAAFMGGLALGSGLAGRLSASIKRPLRTYGAIEIGIAIYAVLVPLLFSWVDNLYAHIWQQFHPGFFGFSIWRFALSCLMLLAPTTLMGATLPVLAAALLRSSSYDSSSVTRLYTCNLVGAIFGTLTAGFILLPTLGLRNTIFFAAFVNLVIGLLAISAERAGESLEVEDHVAVDPSAAGASIESKEFWMFCAFISGFVTISTQVAWTRLLSMIIGSSTYAFSIVVAMFLIGLSAGAYVIARKDYSEKLRQTLLKVELATAVSLFFSLTVVAFLPALLVKIGLLLHLNSWIGLLALQIACAALLILLPAFLMGTVMPLVLIWAGGQRESVVLVGQSYAINTIGAIAGAFLAGFVLIPKATTRFTVLFAASLCVIVAGFAYRPGPKAKDPALLRAFVVGGSFAMVLVLCLATAALNIPRMNLDALSIGAYDSLVRVLAKTREIGGDANSETGPAEHRLLMYEEGTTSTVSVRKDWDSISMAINGRTNGSDVGDMPTQVMLGQLPILVAPSLKNGLVVGFATGVTAGAMLQSPLESLECVELEPATIKGSRYFEHVNNRPLDDPRLHMIIDDARTYLRVTPAHYDMIVSEPSHPWVPGVANLFTKEFFELGRDRLSESGVFVQWLQIYQLSTDSLRSALATYSRVFPHVLLFRVGGIAKGKDLLLLGSNRALSLDHLGERMLDPKISAELTRIQMNSEANVRSWLVCDESRLVPAVAGAVINTDDNMHIETTVPREAFRPLMQSNGEWIESLANK
ncbi:MAG TPA: fused MFS/spermidine synthase [Pyrinomonadaceae bacterium]|nr:fused MFS/spermidine synthase [Pyrinomonadaceae bacterium]